MMNAKKWNLIFSLIALVLVLGSTISVLFAWYVTNDKAKVNSIGGTIKSNYIEFVDSCIFKEKEPGVPFPQTDERHLGGLLEGDAFYYGIQVKSIAEDVTGTFTIRVGSVNGGAFFKTETNEVTQYNMCDVYQYSLEEVWVDDSIQVLDETQKEVHSFVHTADSQYAQNTNLLQNYEWHAQLGQTISFIFKLEMKIDGVIPDNIPRNQIGNQNLTFQNIFIYYS